MGFYVDKLTSRSSLESELWAIYRGLTIVMEKGILNVKIESDSLDHAVNLINGAPATREHQFAALIEDSKVLILSSTGLHYSCLPTTVWKTKARTISLHLGWSKRRNWWLYTYEIPAATMLFSRDDYPGASHLQAYDCRVLQN